MPVNDFEKKVQDTMMGFDINPSADLWKKVEHRIRKEKKRRFIFWWPLGLLFLAGGIGLAIWLPALDAPSIVSNEKETLPEIKSKTISVEKDEPSPIIQNKEESITKTQQLSPIGVIKPVKNKSAFENKPVVENKSLVEDKATIEDKPVVQVKPVIENKPAIVSAPEPPAAPVTQDKEKIKIKKLTQWGLGFSAGRSAIVFGLGNLNKRLYASAQSAPGNPAQLASDRSTGDKGYFSLSAEIFMRRPVSPRLDLVAAMGYQYLSNRILTGERVDSNRIINNFNSTNLNVDNYYRPAGMGSTGYYANQFHFISASGELSWRFSGQKMNFRWNNGFSYDRLIGSSMLHYDQTLQGYYKDNKRLTKNHLFFNTALSLPVGKRLTLNPFSSYSLTSVMRNAGSDSARTHFSNYGLRIRLLLDRKK